MYLKRLELSGFKSFARKTTLLFNAPVTAVVGPNGSGKSNVAEAFRWALGEQSLTSIRGKRGEDFIFNGSNEAARLNHASVTIVFDNSPDASACSDRSVGGRGADPAHGGHRPFPLEYEEVIVARHVYRDGTNEYFLNQSKVRLKDILELIASVGLGQSNHYIISQGEADRMLSANRIERLKMIEDALGLAIFEYKRKEATKKLEKTEENLRQVESLRREITPHLKYLKKQVEQIEKAEAMKAELRCLYRDYFRDEALYLKTTRNDLHKEKTRHQHELGRIEREKAELEAFMVPDLGSKQQILDQRREAERSLTQVRHTKDEVSRTLGRLEGMIEAEKALQKTVARPGHNEGRCPVCGQKVAPEQAEADAEQLERIQSLKEQRIFELQNQRDAAHNLLHDAGEQEEVLMRRMHESHASMEDMQEKTRTADQRLFAVQSRKQEVVSTLALVKIQEEKLEIEEADFKRESGEAAVLLGRQVLEYRSEYAYGNGVIPAPDQVEGKSPAEDLPAGRQVQVVFASRQEQDVKRRQIERLKIRIEEVGGGHSDVLKEFQELSERDQFLAREVTDLMQGAESLRKLMDDLTVQLKVQFKEGLQKINAQFGAYFQVLFDGGSASLELAALKPATPRLDLGGDLGGDESVLARSGAEDDDKPKEGIEINVSLPRKKIRGLQMLSGGERTLTSLALLFAISQVNPPPFLVLDETDAALDESNSKKYGEMLQQLALKSQLIIITHNRETMAHAGVLYGITMGKDAVSRVLSIKFEDASQIAVR